MEKDQTKGIALSEHNILKAMKILRRKSFKQDYKFPYILVPISRRVLSNRYRGLGRPRKADYDYEEINYSGILVDLDRS
jgi:hypothetical protein